MDLASMCAGNAMHGPCAAIFRKGRVVCRMMVAYEKDGKVLVSCLLDEFQCVVHRIAGIGTSQAAVNEIVEHVHDDKYRIVYHELVYSEFFYFVDEFRKYFIFKVVEII